MNKKDIISELEDLKIHSCYNFKLDEIGWYSCCHGGVYEGHGEDCTRIQALNEAIRLIEQNKYEK